MEETEMAIGIIGYGAYIPKYRIKAEEYVKAWGSFSAPGVKEKSLPGYDEDTVTLAVEAARHAIGYGGIDPEKIETVYLATTSGPYVEKPLSSTLAAAVGTGEEVRTADFMGSTRAGTTALLACFDRVAAQGKGLALVVASDVPLGVVDSGTEHAFGAGAAAFVIGEGSPIAVLEGSYSMTIETLGERFRRAGETYTRDLELRVNFLEECLQKSVDGLLRKLNLAAEKVNYVIPQQPDASKSYKALGKFKFSKEALASGSIATLTGDTGVASSLLSLAHVLDQARANERIIVASYGGGSDALSLLVKEGTGDRRTQAGSVPKVKDLLERKEYVDYVTYLKLKKYLSTFKS
jgi:hydroxymethylglutaryl-CoA synthase